MEYVWKGAYKGGEIQIRAESIQELDKEIGTLLPHVDRSSGASPQNPLVLPKLEGVIGCSEAVRAALSSQWGREPKTMAELQHVFELNALFFGSGTVSGVLNYLTRGGEVRRLQKDGRWAYTLKG